MEYDKFRQNPVIDTLAKLPYWTLTKSDDKMPIDIYKFFDYVATRNDIPEFFYGATEADGNTPFTTLDDLYQSLTVDLKNALDTKILPDFVHDVQVGPVAFRLTCRTQPYVVLDIEPSASEEIRQKFLNTKFLYCETSMSGKGLHMIFDSKDILAKYPFAAMKPALKNGADGYEILINHYVTFTGNNIVLPTSTDDTFFYEEFEKLASEATEPMDTTEATIDTDVSNIYKSQYILDIIKPRKTYAECANDENDKSKQDWTFICSLASQLLKITDTYTNVHEFTIDELASLLYVITTKYIPHREKHDRSLNGGTWLEYEVTQAIGFVIAKRKESQS